MARDGRGCERKCASRTKMTQNWLGGMSRARATRMARATGVSVDAGRAEEWVTRKGGSRTGRGRVCRRGVGGREEQRGGPPERDERVQWCCRCWVLLLVLRSGSGTLALAACPFWLSAASAPGRALATGPARAKRTGPGARANQRRRPPCLPSQARAGGGGWRPEG